ncbi:hypothetical protein GBA52_003102 [Prunus armeniaca]|nr:hypothetical protein GBA52_003102 [Prunus armeniaca]
MLILTQSYTASLASLLTVQQLQPTVSDIKDVLRNRDNVGFAENTYINELLKQVGFDDSKIKMFRSFEECDELLSKGSANGGLSKAFSSYTRSFTGSPKRDPRRASFLHKHRHILMHPDDSRASGWRRIRAMFKMFNEKELSSCMFKSPQHRDGIAGAGGEVNAAASPNNNWPESQGSYISNHADFAEQATPSNGQVSPEIVSAVNHEYHNCKNLLKQLNNTVNINFPTSEPPGKSSIVYNFFEEKKSLLFGLWRVTCQCRTQKKSDGEKQKRTNTRLEMLAKLVLMVFHFQFIHTLEFLQYSNLPVWDRFKNIVFWRQLTVREGRRPGMAYDAKNCEANSAEVMLIVQILISPKFLLLASAASSSLVAYLPAPADACSGTSVPMEA